MKLQVLAVLAFFLCAAMMNGQAPAPPNAFSDWLKNVFVHVVDLEKMPKVPIYMSGRKIAETDMTVEWANLNNMQVGGIATSMPTADSVQVTLSGLNAHARLSLVEMKTGRGMRISLFYVKADAMELDVLDSSISMTINLIKDPLQHNLITNASVTGCVASISTSAPVFINGNYLAGAVALFPSLASAIVQQTANNLLCKQLPSAMAQYVPQYLSLLNDMAMPLIRDASYVPPVIPVPPQYVAGAGTTYRDLTQTNTVLDALNYVLNKVTGLTGAAGMNAVFDQYVPGGSAQLTDEILGNIVAMVKSPSQITLPTIAGLPIIQEMQQQIRAMTEQLMVIPPWFDISATNPDGSAGLFMKFELPVNDTHATPAQLTIQVNAGNITGLNFANWVLEQPVNPYTVLTQVEVPSVTMDLSFTVNVTLPGLQQGDASNCDNHDVPMFANAAVGSYVVENVRATATLVNNHMYTYQQYVMEKNDWSAEQLLNSGLGCILSKLVHTNTSFYLATDVAQLELTFHQPNQFGVDAQMDTLVNNIVAVVIEKYKHVLPAFLNGMGFEMAGQTTNQLMQQLREQAADPTACPAV